MNVHQGNVEHGFVPAGAAQELTVSNSVVALNAAPAGATHGMLSVKSNAVLVGFGRDPANAGAGLLLAANTLRVFTKEALGMARFIRSAGSDGVVSVEWGAF